MSTLRRLSGFASTAVVVAVVATAVASPANAEIADGLDVNFKADTTTVIAKTGQPVVFGSTTLATRTDLMAVEGTLDLPTTTATLKAGPLTLANFTISIVNPSKVTGTGNLIANEGQDLALDLKVAQTFQIRLDKVAPLGVGTGSLTAGSSNITLVPGGGNCITAPTTASLTGSLNVSALLAGTPASAEVKGTYTIPPFRGDCGAFAPILNAIIAGPGNTLSVKLTEGKIQGLDNSAVQSRLQARTRN